MGRKLLLKIHSIYLSALRGPVHMQFVRKDIQKHNNMISGALGLLSVYGHRRWFYVILGSEKTKDSVSSTMIISSSLVDESEQGMTVNLSVLSRSPTFKLVLVDIGVWIKIRHYREMPRQMGNRVPATLI